MTTLLFDIETDGFVKQMTTIHSLVCEDLSTGQVYSFHGNDVSTGVEMLRTADKIIGHNIINFDIKGIKKLYPDWSPQGEVVDTLVLSRLYFADIKDKDFLKAKQQGCMLPSRLIGSHSLEAWGYRLGVYKGDFGKTTTWQEWSKEMQYYCEQDVVVTRVLFKHLLQYTKKWGTESSELEHAFAEIISQQEDFGFAFNKSKAVELYGKLASKRDELEQALKNIFKPIDKGYYFTPKVNNTKKGYMKGVEIWKHKLVEFNPASRDHIAERLKEKYGWTPTEFTDNGKPKIDETVISKLDFSEAPLISEYLLTAKRISQLAEGTQAWLKTLSDEDERIHGGVNTNGAVTGRCTHYNPNVAQVPSVGTPYGEECRELFQPPEGYYQLGCDASGLELRCLAHYITKYDGGTYRDIILHGDIHTENQKNAGLGSRNEAKRFIYAYLYGGGDELIGSLFLPNSTCEEKKKYGRKIKTQFLKQTPALRALIEKVKDTAKTRGYLKGLDGRYLHVRSEHSALNLLLQSAGALIMKKATIIMWQDFKRLGFTFGVEVGQMAHIHDEYQLAVRNGIDSKVVGAIATGAIRKAGEYFRFRCPLDGEYKIGSNWKETH